VEGHIGRTPLLRLRRVSEVTGCEILGKAEFIDDAYRVTDQSALSIVHQLLREEGIFVGLSSGINLAGALRLAKEGGPGQVIVTLLCDSGIRYMSRLFNPEWLRAHGLDPEEPMTIDDGSCS